MRFVSSAVSISIIVPTDRFAVDATVTAVEPLVAPLVIAVPRDTLNPLPKFMIVLPVRIV